MAKIIKSVPVGHTWNECETEIETDVGTKTSHGVGTVVECSCGKKYRLSDDHDGLHWQEYTKPAIVMG